MCVCVCESVCVCVCVCYKQGPCHWKRHKVDTLGIHCLLLEKQSCKQIITQKSSYKCHNCDIFRIEYCSCEPDQLVGALCSLIYSLFPPHGLILIALSIANLLGDQSGWHGNLERTSGTSHHSRNYDTFLPLTPTEYHRWNILVYNSLNTSWVLACLKKDHTSELHFS